jgi:cytochrome c-type biogenesis protein CcmH
MQKFWRITLYSLLILGLFVFAQPLVAQDSQVPDDEVNEVARDIYCPVCENTPLDVCATQACADWRELIRTKLGEGQSKDQIFDYFARQYGDGVLANPPRRGVSLIILWVLPVVLVLLAAFFFSRVMRKMRAAPEITAATTGIVEPQAQITTPISRSMPVSEDDYLAQIEEELGKSK